MTNEIAQTGEEAALAADEDFAALLDESFGVTESLEGRVVDGTVIAIENDMALIDVGLKAEGRVPLREFSTANQPAELKVGDRVEVFLDRIENARGEAVLSREKARREEAWTQLEKAFSVNERVTGVIFGRVKGGFTVDLSGAVAFLPGSQVDVRPVRDIGPLLGTEQPFQILKMDRRRGNIVVSRRAVLEETRAEARAELIANLKEGQVIDGVVKNITDYGAFVDLGGIDGLLHVTDISWRRVNHPTEALNVDQTVKVQIIRVNPETQRISLGMKQLEADPWDGVEAKYPISTKLKGRVTNITDYGAFVELEPGVEGLVHVSEMSWTKKNVPPGKIVSTSQEVEVMVLDVDPNKRRISLGLKQCTDNPWDAFIADHPVGSVVEGQVRNITEFGLFIGIDADLDGMVHLSDLGWTRSGEEALADYKKGDEVKAKVLDVDIAKERISLGIKQLTEDPFAAVEELKKGQIVTCTVAKIVDNGIEVTVADGAPGFIRKSELSRDRSEQRPERYAEGDKVDAKITNIDSKSRRLTLSIKAREVADEKKAMAEYGSSDSGASLGDILGAAMTKAREKAAETADTEGEEEAEAEAEATAEAEEPEAAAEAEAETAAEPAAVPEAAAEAEPEAAAEAEEPEAKPEVEPIAEPEAAAEAEPEAEGEQAAAKAEAAPEPKKKAKPRAKSATKPKAKAKPKSKSKSKSKKAAGDEPEEGAGDGDEA
jgi:small subunit ribosomal protein S1